ncbi:hypothetical protein L484_020471 [Morus notabilis]|uniref:Uncharacterized protein n=1 Tax=Morus notabilis TaxID=981085 RepID=W9SJE6_9ROSA|nr:hypothetical protein L484_020471 [Morus notabilis]
MDELGHTEGRMKEKKRGMNCCESKRLQFVAYAMRGGPAAPGEGRKEGRKGLQRRVTLLSLAKLSC